MKKIYLATCLVVLFACNQQVPKQETTTNETKSEQFFGDKISADGAKPLGELSTMMGDKKELTTKLIGTVSAVCQKKGCWMNLKNGEDSIRVTFKDYAFFMPKDASGREAIIEGKAMIEETSIDQLKEYAKDAGKTKEEIAAITTPERELVFEASGVILR